MIDAALWQPAGELTLEPTALFAARENQTNVAVTAGPGAGKTEMLAQRADFLLRTNLCAYPRRILAISFKVDAARNIKQRVRDRCGPRLSARLDSQTFHAFAKKIIDHFRPVLTGDHALDADYTIAAKTNHPSQLAYKDFVPLAIEILEKSEMARSAVRQTYTHVFLDEFQDCTDRQYELIKQAFLGTNIKLTAVGDVKQRIMGFADAMDGVFELYRHDFEALPLNLYQNFRSLPRLRRMQNEMVRVMDPGAALHDDEIKGLEGTVDVYQFEDCALEAKKVASLIEHEINVVGLPASEIAVLIRQQPDFYGESLMRELSEREIPYRNELDLQDLSTEPVARLIVDFLSILVSDLQPEAYARLAAVVEYAGLGDEPAYVLNARWHRLLDDSREKIRLGERRLRPFVEEFLNLLGSEILAGLSPDYVQASYLKEQIDKTYKQVRKLLSSDEDQARALKRFHEDSSVRILTIHKSKGLEFESVFILGVEKELFFGDCPDEQSTFFVGISRAKRALYLTSAAYREKPASYTKYWKKYRTPYTEFLNYASSDV